MTSIDNSNSNSNNSVALSLEHKLRATLNSYRQRRDEAHRGQQLAAERLRLVAEEWEIVQSSVLTAQKNLKTLQDKAGGSAAARQEHADRQRDVEHLTKEVRSSLVVARCESFYFLQSVCTLSTGPLPAHGTGAETHQAGRPKGHCSQRRVAAPLLCQ